MKQYWKGYAAGLITALLIGCLIGTASASVGKVMQELEYRNIRVSLDGEILDLRNAIGDPVEPFMFGGTNYLPVRALAESLGLQVAWDGANATVVLTTPEKSAGPDGSGVTGTSGSGDAASGETAETPDETDPRHAVMGLVGASYVNIKQAQLTRDNSGRPAVVFTYTWTNRSDRIATSVYSVSEMAFQDGIELEYASISDTSVYNPATSFKRLKPGASIDIQAAFVLWDETSNVEFEVSEYENYSGQGEIVYREFLLPEMEEIYPVPSNATQIRA